MQINSNTMTFVMLLLVILAVGCSEGRPHIGEAPFGDIQAGDPGAMDNSLLARGDNNHMMNPEDTALASLQMQLLQQYANNLRMGSSPWDFRAPMDKRQVRYRQCYFNPISCFRK